MEDLNLYTYYVPSLAAAVIFTIVFGVLTVAHVVLIVRTKRKFPLIVVVGGLFEAVGHAARAYSHSHLDAETPFIIQVLLVLLAPILFAAGIYMLLGRLIKASGYPKLSIIRPTWVTKIFLLGDILCFLVQAAGAAKLVKPKSSEDIKSGENTVLGGLALQILIFGLFLVVAIVFHVRYRKRRANGSKNLVERHLWSLYICSILVSVRNVFRFLEYKMGTDGYLYRHEWPLYVLDVSLMAVVMLLALDWYRGSLEAPEHSVLRDECDGDITLNQQHRLNDGRTIV